MALFNPRLFPQIVGDMIARIISVTPITDVNYGSVLTTMLEAAAQEDDEQYFQMLEIIRGYSLDTTTGTDLDDRAEEYGLQRRPAQTASTKVTISDTAITKISTNTYSGLPGSAAGSFSINGNDSNGFPASGSIIIGRGTPNVETVPYTSITNNGNYVTFVLGAALANDHGTDETIIFSQGGDRLIPAGTVVLVPASDINPKIEFTLDSAATILDGESSVTGVLVTASEPGSAANVPVGAIQSFATPPFSTATVTNPFRVTNGKDEETDQELRDRIKDTIQSLSRGTGKSIITGAVGLVSETENKRVVSASLIEPTIPADVVKLFIDDGTGFVPSFKSVGLEVVVSNATGGEKFVKTTNFPLMKAFVETQSEETFALSGGESLFVEVGGQVETVQFLSTDFDTPGKATAQEVLEKINKVASLFEARVSSGGTKVRIFSRSNFDEQIRVTGGSANVALNFPTDQKFTSKLYLKRNNSVKLLSKDGVTASIECANSAGYNFSGQDHNLAIVVDGKNKNIQYVNFTPNDFVNSASAQAEEVVEIINEQLAGASAIVSSNDSRVTLISNIKRSQDSKIRIVDNFDHVFLQSGLVYTNITTASRTNATNVALFAANNDRVYFGHNTVQFGSIWVKLNTPANTPMSFSFEYWNGSIWKQIGVSDGTNGFTQDGFILFRIPRNWAETSVNSQTAYWVRIERTGLITTAPVESRLRICSANEILGFSNLERVGENKDYTLNRFIGQIELESPLQAGDSLTLGSSETRAAVVSSLGPFGLTGGQSLNIEIDGVAQSVNFVAADFLNPGAALAQEVVTRINKDLNGATASTASGGQRVKIISNKFDGGTIKVTGGTANTFLQFPTHLVSSLVSHIPSVESVAGPYTFSQSQSVIVIIDKNAQNNLTVPCYRAGTTGTGTTASLIVDTTLSSVFAANTDLDSNYEVLMVTGPQAGNKRNISAYNAGTNTITLASPFSSPPGVSQTYQILPKNAIGVVRLWNNRQITLLNVQAEVRTSSGGTKVQIASKNLGENAAVQVSGGSGNAVLQFPTQQRIGVDGYRHFTGLAQITQWTIDGRDDDLETYPGIRAAGVQIEVAEPVSVPIKVQISVTTKEGISLSSITNDVKSAISAYINQLPVGGDVIISEIIVAVKNVNGVADVKVNLPVANVAIADNELARVKESDIIVG